MTKINKLHFNGVDYDIGDKDIHDLTEKQDLVENDEFIIADSENIFNNKKIKAKGAIYDKVYNYIIPVDNTVQKGKFAYKKDISVGAEGLNILSHGTSYYIQRILSNASSETKNVSISAGALNGSGGIKLRVLDAPSSDANVLDETSSQTPLALNETEFHPGQGSLSTSSSSYYYYGGPCFEVKKDCIFKNAYIRASGGSLSGVVNEIKIYKGTAMNSMSLYATFNVTPVIISSNTSAKIQFPTPLVLKKGEIRGCIIICSGKVFGDGYSSGDTYGDQTFGKLIGTYLSDTEPGDTVNFNGGNNKISTGYVQLFGLSASNVLDYQIDIPGGVSDNVYIEVLSDDSDTDVVLGGTWQQGMSMYNDGQTVSYNGFDVYFTLFGYSRYYTLSQVSGGTDYQYIVSDKVNNKFVYGQNVGTIKTSGLTPGKYYNISNNGTISVNGLGKKIGFAISDDTLELQDKSEIVSVIQESYSDRLTEENAGRFTSQDCVNKFCYTNTSSAFTVTRYICGEQIMAFTSTSHMGFTSSHNFAGGFNYGPYIYVCAVSGTTFTIKRRLIDYSATQAEGRESIVNFTYTGGSSNTFIIGMYGEKFYGINYTANPSNNAPMFFSVDMAGNVNGLNGRGGHRLQYRNDFAILQNGRVVVYKLYDGSGTSNYDQRILIFDNPETMNLIQDIPLRRTQQSRIWRILCVYNVINVIYGVMIASNLTGYICTPKWQVE